MSYFNIQDAVLLKETATTDRLETKFILTADRLPFLMKLLQSDYSLLQFGAHPISGYTTQYFDTPDFHFYLAHHNGRNKRWKARERTYQNDNKTFLEIKFQSAAGRVIKNRIRRNDPAESWQKKDLDFLTDKLPIDPLALKPVLSSQYNRITLVDTQLASRVTIDLDIQFSASNSQHQLNNFVIVEIKQEKNEISPAHTVLKKMGIRPVALSKYCLGINYLYPGLKKNNFKPRLRAITKLLHEHTDSYTAA